MHMAVGIVTYTADALAASTALRTFIAPLLTALTGAAGLVCAFFLVVGGIQYTSSRGNPENLASAKKTIKNALIGLTLALGAVLLTALLTHAYSAGTGGQAKLLDLVPLQPIQTNWWDIIIQTIVHVLQTIIQAIGQPFIQALAYFAQSTPLMASNAAVFNLWLVIVAIADVLFVLVVILLGFQIMSFDALGFEELDIKQLLPQLALIFLMINTSIFLIDGVISLSNAMIHTLQAAFPPMNLWDLLAKLSDESSGMGLAALLILLAFLVLTVLLLIYYVCRLITLYIGAALSPLVLLLSLLPAFRDFAVAATKLYLTTIFVLFVQVVIMQLASSLFLGLLEGTNNGQPNTLMALVVGLATVLALLKTQGVMQELSYAASTPRAARQMTGAFMKGMRSTHAFQHGRRGAMSYIQPRNKKRELQVKVTTERGDGGGDIPRTSTSTPALQMGEAQPAARFAAEPSPHRRPVVEGGEV